MCNPFITYSRRYPADFELKFWNAFGNDGDTEGFLVRNGLRERIADQGHQVFWEWAVLNLFQ
jgi:hypothetical protein